MSERFISLLLMLNAILYVEDAEDGHPRSLSIKVQTWILDRNNTNCAYMCFSKEPGSGEN